MGLLAATAAGSVHNGWLIIFVPLFFYLAFEVIQAALHWMSVDGAYRRQSYHVMHIGGFSLLLVVVAAIIFATIAT